MTAPVQHATEHSAHATLQPGDRTVRVSHGATTTTSGEAPYNTIHYQVFYPAIFRDSPEVTNTGILEADTSSGPWPVLLWLGGVNVNIDGYRWLGQALATQNIAFVTFSHVGETTPGDYGLSPGIDLGALGVDTFGTRPSSTTVGPLLQALSKHADRDSPIQNMLDMTKVFLGGHSAGGTMALLNANPEWFPSVVGAVTFAGHAVPAAPLGHPPGTALRTEPTVPSLILGGTEDAVIAQSAGRYATADGNAHDPMRATFDHPGTPRGSALLEIQGAGHLSVCHPTDTTSARGFLEPIPSDAEHHRAVIVDAIADFVSTGSCEELDRYSTDPVHQATAGRIMLKSTGSS